MIYTAKYKLEGTIEIDCDNKEQARKILDDLLKPLMEKSKCLSATTGID